MIITAHSGGIDYRCTGTSNCCHQDLFHGHKLLLAFFVRYVLDKGEDFVVKINWQIQFGIWMIKFYSFSF